MADVVEKERGTSSRGKGTVVTGKLPAVALERGTTTKQDAGNPGSYLGREAKDGVVYAKYRAEKGTWVSASLVQQGYDRLYGKDVAYGAYLGVVVDPEGQPLKTPDKIRPGQEYLIPVGTAVSFEDQPLAGYRAPQTKVDTNVWKEGGPGRWTKDRFLALSDMPYPSFELKGPKPPSSVPRDAVAYWLSLHRNEMIKAEKDWHVSRLAIAGIIAWEALENPEAASFKAVGPGKIHLVGEDGQLSWPEVVEVTGRVKELTLAARRIRLSEPGVAINYIGAILDFIATVAEARGWNLRNNPEILGQVYHAWTAEQWISFMKTKPLNAPFTIVPGTMGKWIDDDRKYLEKAVGPPVRW